jgi:L-alanine-DL-glutamate epimerase-like enolase superfamily enzyme
VSHWYLQEQLMRERHADLGREATRGRRGGPSRRDRPERGVGAQARSIVAAALAAIRARRAAPVAERLTGASCGLPGPRPIAGGGAWTLDSGELASQAVRRGAG